MQEKILSEENALLLDQVSLKNSSSTTRLFTAPTSCRINLPIMSLTCGAKGAIYPMQLTVTGVNIHLYMSAFAWWWIFSSCSFLFVEGKVQHAPIGAPAREMNQNQHVQDIDVDTELVIGRRWKYSDFTEVVVETVHRREVNVLMRINLLTERVIHNLFVASC